MIHTLPFALTPNEKPYPCDERSRLMAEPGFGKIFTDHMVTIEWSAERGWHEAKVRARAPFSIDPASAVLHYAQEIFEGMKAYRGTDGDIRLFRPWDNARRFNGSARRMAMPEIPEDLFLDAIERLVRIDSDWIPDGDGSLYLRPFMFANEAFLGVRPAARHIFCVIASPAGAYFKRGEKPISVWVSDDYSRAASGGTGAAKCGGNYAASLVAQSKALAQGCEQVVFLDAAERRWVEELGGMNIFFVMEDGRLKTPPLGTILPGITRASVIELARSEGRIVEEARYSFDEWRADAATSRLREVFVCGTAATIVSVGTIRSRHGDFLVGGGKLGPVARDIRDRLVAVQRGGCTDKQGWSHRIAIKSN